MPSPVFKSWWGNTAMMQRVTSTYYVLLCHSLNAIHGRGMLRGLREHNQTDASQ